MPRSSSKGSEVKLSPRERAEDILLGSLGYGEGASIKNLERTPTGYQGVGKYIDGEEFDFVNDEELDELQEWAIGLMLAAP